MKTFTVAEFRQWGAQGGKKATHALSVERAREMSLKRWAKYRKKAK